MKTKKGPTLGNFRWVNILMVALLPLWLVACASTPDEKGQKFSAQEKYNEALTARSLKQPDEEITKLKEYYLTRAENERVREVREVRVEKLMYRMRH